MATHRTRTIPAPPVNPETQPFWDAAAAGQAADQEVHAPAARRITIRARICPFCFSDRTEWQQASGRGTIYTYSVMRRAPVPVRDRLRDAGRGADDDDQHRRLRPRRDPDRPGGARGLQADRGRRAAGADVHAGVAPCRCRRLADLSRPGRSAPDGLAVPRQRERRAGVPRRPDSSRACTRPAASAVDDGDVAIPSDLPHHAIPPIRSWPGPRIAWDHVGERLAPSCGQPGHVPLLIGCDCSIVVGTTQALRRAAGDDLHVLYVDGDFDDAPPDPARCQSAAAVAVWLLTRASPFWAGPPLPPSQVTVIGWSNGLPVAGARRCGRCPSPSCGARPARRRVRALDASRVGVSAVAPRHRRVPAAATCRPPISPTRGAEPGGGRRAARRAPARSARSGSSKWPSTRRCATRISAASAPSSISSPAR